MNVEQLLASLTPDIVDRFRTAVELGKWADGRVLTPQQRQICMQAVLAWEYQHLPEDQRTGYIDRGTKKEDDACDSHTPTHDDEFKPLRLV